jgi:hypothetical protein
MEPSIKRIGGGSVWKYMASQGFLTNEFTCHFGRLDYFFSTFAATKK